MNRIVWTDHLTPYEADYARWCEEQGSLLRAGRLDALDREKLAEEIESLGRSDKREIESRLKVLLVHLLKWRFQPKERSNRWKSAVREQRNRIVKTLRESPSLQAYPGEVLADEYAFAVPDAADETGLPENTFPSACPFTIDQVLDETFWPEAE